MPLVSKLTVAASVPPITVAEAKSYMRVDISDDDALIGSLIDSATEYYETVTRRALITQTWTLKLNGFTSCPIELTRAPVISVSSIKYQDEYDVEQTLSTDVYAVDTDSEPGRVFLKFNQSYPATLGEINAVTITYTAGYGAAATDVPEEYRSTIRLLVSGSYENRLDATEKKLNISPNIGWLLQSQRVTI